jgi:TrmH family RNA methyltransferase
LVAITSTDNPRVKAFAKLKKSRERRRTGLFLIEGHREVERAIACGIDIETLVVCRELLGDTALDDSAGDLLEVAEGPMRRIAVRENPPGAIAVARQFATGLNHIELPSDPLILIAERVEKPGNLGAMMRTGDAVGVDAIVVADAATDIFNPNVVRASQGALFSMPIATATTRDTISWVAERGIVVFGGYPQAGQEIWEAAMTGPAAVLVGAEDVGISAAWEGVATPVRIPMAGSADSLNASISAAILLFEAVRQRRN